MEERREGAEQSRRSDRRDCASLYRREPQVVIRTGADSEHVLTTLLRLQDDADLEQMAAPRDDEDTDAVPVRYRRASSRSTGRALGVVPAPWAYNATASSLEATAQARQRRAHRRQFLCDRRAG